MIEVTADSIRVAAGDDIARLRAAFLQIEEVLKRIDDRDKFATLLDSLIKAVASIETLPERVSAQSPFVDGDALKKRDPSADCAWVQVPDRWEEPVRP